MAINSASFAKTLWPGINAWYGRSYDEWPVEYTELFDTTSSNRAYEEDVGTTGFGLAQIKPEGQALAYDEESQAFVTRYAHVVYALGFVVTREIYEDDQYDIVGKRRAEALAFSMRQTKEINGANVYNRAFNTSFLGGDGSAMIVNDHLNFSGGTWSNLLSTAADLSEAALEQACIDIMKYTNDRGLRISVMPETLIIPVDTLFEAKRILGSDGRVSTADNDLNALKSMGKFTKVVVNHYLTDTNAWFIRTNVQNGMKLFERRSMDFGIDNDFDTENAKYKASERYVFGWTDPRSIYGTDGA
ncbi:MAG: Mu-like prophage major head subunit gpT family protein [Nitrosopumilus sp.]